MHGNTNCPSLIGYRSCDRLTNPPSRIGRELVPLSVLELLHRLDQADISFLYEIKEMQSTIGVFFRDTHHQAQIGLNEFVLRGLHQVFAPCYLLGLIQNLIYRTLKLDLDVLELFLVCLDPSDLFLYHIRGELKTILYLSSVFSYRQSTPHTA